MEYSLRKTLKSRFMNSAYDCDNIQSGAGYLLDTLLLDAWKPRPLICSPRSLGEPRDLTQLPIADYYHCVVKKNINCNNLLPKQYKVLGFYYGITYPKGMLKFCFLMKAFRKHGANEAFFQKIQNSSIHTYVG